MSDLSKPATNAIVETQHANVMRLHGHFASRQAAEDAITRYKLVHPQAQFGRVRHRYKYFTVEGAR